MTAVQDNVEAPPAPPPAPSAGDGLRALKDDIRAKQRTAREMRVRSATQTLRTLHRGYWITGAAIAGAVIFGLLTYWFLSYQRSTTLALAGLRGDATPTSAPAPVINEGMPNPLQTLPLSEGAAYVLGANVKTNDKGESVGFTELPPMRSSSAMGQLLDGVDLCKAYVSLGDVANVVVTFEATPGAYPLIDPQSDMCAAPLSPSTVPVPTDPIPPTTVTVPAS